jgi:hypothetical protein
MTAETEREEIMRLAHNAPMPRRHTGGDISHRWQIVGYPQGHVLYQCGCGENTTRDLTQLRRATRETR